MSWLSWIAKRLNERSTFGAIIAAVGAYGIYSGWGFLAVTLVVFGTALAIVADEQR